MAGEKLKPGFYERETIRLTKSNIILNNRIDELIAENRQLNINLRGSEKVIDDLQKQITELQLVRVK